MSEKTDSAVSWATAKAQDAQRRWLQNRDRHESLRVGEELFLRDQSAYASVLGSAVALRLFLFVIPVNLAIAALVNMLRLGSVFNKHLEQSAVTGSVAHAASGRDFWSSLVLLITSLWFTLWTGRSLARVLGTSASLAWRLHARASKVKLMRVVTLSAVVFALILISNLLGAIRDTGGIAPAVLNFTGVIAVGSVAWFFALTTLPSGTSDPGAQLPGSALVGLGLAVLLWLVHVYLPNKIARSADRLGSAAATVSTLGFFFFFGRLITSAFVLNAVIYERYGSLSQVVFGLPGARAVPRRWPKVATFFALDGAQPREVGVGTGADEPDGPSDTEVLLAALSGTELVDDVSARAASDEMPASEVTAAEAARPVTEE